MGGAAWTLEGSSWQGLPAASGNTVVAGAMLVAETTAAMDPSLAAVAEAAVTWEYRLRGHAQAAGH